MLYELTPTDGKKSFYGKAHVYIAADGSETLISYVTPVARKEKDGTIHRLWGGWSATTGRHIAAFCGMNKAQFLSIPRESTPADKAAAYNGTLYR